MPSSHKANCTRTYRTWNGLVTNGYGNTIDLFQRTSALKTTCELKQRRNALIDRAQGFGYTKRSWFQWHVLQRLSCSKTYGTLMCKLSSSEPVRWRLKRLADVMSTDDFTSNMRWITFMDHIQEDCQSWLVSLIFDAFCTGRVFTRRNHRPLHHRNKRTWHDSSTWRAAKYYRGFQRETLHKKESTDRTHVSKTNKTPGKGCYSQSSCVYAQEKHIFYHRVLARICE